MQLIYNCMDYHTNKIIFEALTYDDVLLVPNHSDVLPKNVSISSRFSKNILQSKSNDWWLYRIFEKI